MSRRVVYRIQWHEKSKRWRVSVKRIMEAAFNTQAQAVRFAVEYANEELWRRDGQPTQVVLHGKDGRIRWDRTYGRDPKRRKG